MPKVGYAQKTVVIVHNLRLVQLILRVMACYRLILSIKKHCLAYKRNATTFCIATSGSRLSKQEMTAVGETIKKIKQDLPLKICLSVGSVNT
jgi:biotin synthase-like enzyme